MPRGVVIADDLTGAADTGVMFAKRGLCTLVVWSLDAIPDADVWVYSTESRHLPAEQAYGRTLKAAQHFALRGVDWVYKKVDSTLRGNPGIELRAVLDALKQSHAIIAPAFPPQGRTTRDGGQFVNGVPLHETEFAKDVPAANLEDLFRPVNPYLLRLDVLRDAPGLAGYLQKHHNHAIIADAESNADLATLVDAARGTQIWCGSAGLAQALGATCIEGLAASTRTGQATTESAGWRGQGILVIAASRHPATVVQVAHLQAQGIPAIRPEPAWFEAADLPVADMVARILNVMDTHGSAILTTTHLPAMPGMHERLVQRLAETASAVLAQQALAGLVLTGGDTAAAVTAALGAHGLELRGEVESGVPWGVLNGGLASGMPVVTKAGGFGQEKTLASAVDFLGMLIV